MVWQPFFSTTKLETTLPTLAATCGEYPLISANGEEFETMTLIPGDDTLIDRFNIHVYVKDFKTGDRVSYAGAPLGSYSTHRNYPTKNLVKVPDNISFKVAATLMTKGLTTFYLLHKTYPVQKGETVLFHAAAGGVGQIFGQWAKSLGCKVIGTVGSNDKIEKAKNNGYDHIINYNKENFAKKVLEITNDKGVPVVYDGVGKNTLEGSLECLSIRGMMVSFGNASGPLSEINVPKLIQPKGLYLTRPSMQQYLSTKEELDEGSKILFEKISSGKVKIEIFKGYKLENVVNAHKDLEERKILGPWLNNLVKKVAKSRWKDRQDNKAYLTSYITMIWGLMINDLKAVQHSIDVVHRLLLYVQINHLIQVLL